MTLRVALADDEPLARARLRRLLLDADCEVVGEFEDGTALMAWIAGAPTVDVLFLDIRMPGPTGLEVHAELPAGLPVVYVTASPDHAVAAFEQEALDFLVKPVTPERLGKTLGRVKGRRMAEEEASGGSAPGEAGAHPSVVRIPVKAGDGKLLLDLKRITHFEVVDQVVWAWAGGQRYRTAWTSLAEAEEALPGSGFLRIQRHILVRPEAVLGLRTLATGRRAVRLLDGLELEVSRSAVHLLKERLGF